MSDLPIIHVKSVPLSKEEEEQIIREAYIKIARDVKFNEQGGTVEPSDMYRDGNGNVSIVPLIRIDLLKRSGAQ